MDYLVFSPISIGKRTPILKLCLVLVNSHTISSPYTINYFKVDFFCLHNIID